MCFSIRGCAWLDSRRKFDYFAWGPACILISRDMNLSRVPDAYVSRAGRHIEKAGVENQAADAK